jgi:hypothetical protein
LGIEPATSVQLLFLDIIRRRVFCNHYHNNHHHHRDEHHRHHHDHFHNYHQLFPTPTVKAPQRPSSWAFLDRVFLPVNSVKVRDHVVHGVSLRSEF